MARSDIATEPHNTNGLNALKNFLMDIDGYIGLYSIQNGNEQLIDCLRSEVNADILLNHRVLKVGKTAAGRYRLNMMNGKGPETRDFDLVLNCLIAGSDALAFANLSDQELIDAALKSLPASLGNARDHFLEGKIHRWLSSVNALPGGLPARDVLTNHRPEPKEHPGIVVVGDYLFDSTLNGLLDSSDAATDIILTEMMRLRRARAQQGGVSSDKIDRSYFDNYRGVGPYSEVWSRFTDPAYLTDLIKTVWNRAKGSKL